ncbi:glycosyltransferase [Fulvivirga sedimenti]|uniref:Glycosyltransferase n=1 Tax=Fulvivirga sedimenti TaxID=2879465 RepID=A0A9X1KZC6_9BACT|nr:glycosyltransferase [Fulvivirga sedimenti]MCA6078110.1 glycosyltransferase [Fulvivirga sedimenti]
MGVPKDEMEKELDNHGIQWSFLQFNSSSIGKITDMISFSRAVNSIIESGGIDLIHARSYVAGDVALKMHKKYDIPYLFDIRGFWIDERVERGIWNLRNPIRYIAYRYFKKVEGELYRNAAGVITLTHLSKGIISQKWSTDSDCITVIPCAADFSVFRPENDQQKKEFRIEQGIPADDLVISYSGSIGGVYLLDEMLDFYELLQKRYPEAWFLFLTPYPAELILARCKTRNTNSDRIRVTYVDHRDINRFLNLSDINIFFLRESYSISASMPTKLGEIWAAGIPVIANEISDFPRYFVEGTNGLLIQSITSAAMQQCVDQVDRLISTDPEEIRSHAQCYFSLEDAIKKYDLAYSRILGKYNEPAYDE